MKLLMTIFAATIVLGGTLSAQSMVGQINFHLTSPAAVGDATMPAGNVNIQILRSSTDTVALVFRAESGETATALVNRIYDAEASGAGVRLVLRNNRVDRVLLGDKTGFQLLSRD